MQGNRESQKSGWVIELVTTLPMGTRVHGDPPRSGCAHGNTLTLLGRAGLRVSGCLQLSHNDSGGSGAESKSCVGQLRWGQSRLSCRSWAEVSEEGMRQSPIQVALWQERKEPGTKLG